MLSNSVCSINEANKVTVQEYLQKGIPFIRLYPLSCCTEIISVGFPGADPGFGQGGALGPEAESCRRSEA